MNKKKQFSILGLPNIITKDKLKKAYLEKFNSLYSDSESIIPIFDVADSTLADFIDTCYNLTNEIGKEKSLKNNRDPLYYFDREIFVLGTGRFLNYSLSNHLKGISKAIHIRTGNLTDLSEGQWSINHDLSVSVKELMKKYNAKYSMTLWDNDWANKPIKTLIINWKEGNKYLIKGFEIYGNYFYDWQTKYSSGQVCLICEKFLKRYKSKDNNNDD